MGWIGFGCVRMMSTLLSQDRKLSDLAMKADGR